MDAENDITLQIEISRQRPVAAGSVHNGIGSIGALLMDAGKLSAEDAERVLRLQKTEGIRFGEAALRLKLVTEADIQYALSRQFDYPCLLADEDDVSREIVAAYQPFSPQVEALRAVRSQLMLRRFTDENSGKALAIVSPERHEGRSYIAANLAVVFSQLGERTLLIDADMRFPRQHELFKLENQVGLSSYLAGRTAIPDIHRIEALMGLSVMPAGPTPPNPQEILARPRFASLLESAGWEYDVILIDTSAGGTAADAQTVASRAGGALMVARNNQTQARLARGLADSLASANVPLVGSVLNKA